MRYLNGILLILLALAIFVILKFSTLPTPSFMPNFIGDVVEKPIRDSVSFESYRILENLSIGYVTALIVFLLIDLIPKKRLEKKSFNICQSKIRDIYLNMSIVIASMKMLFDVNKEDSKILISDLKEINKYSPGLEKTYFISEVYLNNQATKNGVKGIFLFHKDLCYLSNRIKEIIDEITILPSSNDLSNKLLETLSSIRSGEFIGKWGRKESPLIPNTPYEIYGLSNEFYDFIQLYLILETFSFKKHKYVYSKLSENQVSELMEIKKDIFNKNNFTNFNGKFYLAGIEYRIENGSLIE